MSSRLSSKQGGLVTQYEFVNFSKSKQKFTFSRSPRFPSVQKKHASEKVQYELPSAFDPNSPYKRATSFGIGDRFKELTARKGK